MSGKNRYRVGVIFGGRSSEHEVSLSSAQNVVAALQEAGHVVVPIGIAPNGQWVTGERARLLGQGSTTTAAISESPAGQDKLEDAGSWAMLPHNNADTQLPTIDVIFPVLHGPYGEDGTVQGLLEMARLPYVGCGVLSSAAAMDKAVAKKLFAAAGLKQTPSQAITRTRWEAEPEAIAEALEAQLDYPLFVKPANMGSSVGVTKARSRIELRGAMDTACFYDGKVMVEQAVPNAREIEVSVLGNDNPVASVPGEILPGGDFYDYDAKYVDDSSQLLIPAPLTSEQTAEVRELAVRAFQAVEGSGLARVDFLVDDATGEIYLNELNTMPGFTRISMYPKLWEASGVSYAELVNRLLELAMERYADRQRNRTTR
jgi:D-alanine-D-alanine ligase